MQSVTEEIEWHLAADPPDSDLAVLVKHSGDGDPVWIATHNGNHWETVEGMPLCGVTHWAELPEGPDQ